MRHAQVLDVALEHGAAKRGRLEQVGRGLGDQPPLAHAPNHVPRSTDALQAPRHVARRLDLANQVDRPHVDSQLERRGRHDRREITLLERLFGRSALVQADAAVVGPERPTSDSAVSADRRRPALPPLSGPRVSSGIGQFVEPGRQLLDRPPVVGEDDRRTVLPHERQQLSSISGQIEPATTCRSCGRGQMTWRSMVAAPAGVDDRDRSRHALALGRRRPRPTRSPPDSARPHRAAAVSPTSRSGRNAAVAIASSRSRKCQEHTSLVAADRVNLVDDHVAMPAEDLPCPAGEHQMQRFRRGDQDVGRLAHDRRPTRWLACRRCGPRPGARAAMLPMASDRARIPSRETASCARRPG